jgi:hypothetical protein
MFALLYPLLFVERLMFYLCYLCLFADSGSNTSRLYEWWDSHKITVLTRLDYMIAVLTRLDYMIVVLTRLYYMSGGIHII